MHSPGRAVDSIADANGFSGVVRVDRGDEVEVVSAYGLAHRGYEISNTVDTQFAIASGTKGLTAVAVASLIEDGSLDLSTTVRSVLGPDLPLIGDDVTVEHLLSHRSGIGDYLDEDAALDLADRYRRGRQLLLERSLRRSDRFRELGGRAGAGPQRRAARVEALRPRLLAPRVERRRDVGRIRCRRLVLERARPGAESDPHRDLEHV